MLDLKDHKTLEKYSSAVTLSDMEVFIFPDLMYSLVLANIMSPRLWEWRRDSWFSKMKKLNHNKKIQRLKQFIMDNFSFNLDLDTWGLTTKEKELTRFKDFITEQILAESNALFGYEGDKYYFDIDIRRHFGLDKYTSEVIPYWKTETLEAMEAFRFKEGYPSGAGECVSLGALYAAASFVVAQLPLNDIYMFATPLHSQNYLDINSGIITNNRRIVTKNMWYNGTELSAKARRALENEKVTIVAHNTGYIHTMYDTATIAPSSYDNFTQKLHSFLKTEITYEILANFLRHNSRLQSCFQLAHQCCGKPRYIEAEKVYSYEHSSKFRVGSPTQSHLLHEIEEDEYYPTPHPDRMLLSELETFFKDKRVIADESETLIELEKVLSHSCINVNEVIHDLKSFSFTHPRLPDAEQKTFKQSKAIELDGVNSADEAKEYLQSIRNENETVDLAFSAFRDLTLSPWKPFLKAALQRNPVSTESLNQYDIDQMYTKLSSLPNYSIYQEPTRLAQPDEVWNFSTGDGLERSLCFMNAVKSKYSDSEVEIQIDGKHVLVRCDGKNFLFPTTKTVPQPENEDFEF
ncbi:hypothetical protein QA601_13525 [Chitinispirillales bacterium ANBcel5]|uniref:hypothetical protein n=1 Tax=Cellulosispirillum alkaliphilum TaxID=3039283 RepID=UPI002A5594BA|nr:hypothetical protein [Chitinispirillales bacterium ANBcel5]